MQIKHHKGKALESDYVQELAALRAENASKQAKIDSLMLEFCPDEMTQEQLDNWAAHQIPCEAAIDAEKAMT